MQQIYTQIVLKKEANQKMLSILIDPDKATESSIKAMSEVAHFDRVDFVFIGGSLLTTTRFDATVSLLRQYISQPIVIFPGSNMQIHESCDALLLLSLLSGRNAEYLIGQHVAAAPMLRSSSLDIIPTGYLLIDGGVATTVSYISNTTPIPHAKPEIAACTALAGELLGLRLIYLDAGSGASQAVSVDMIAKVRATIATPLIVGGGIRSIVAAQQAWQAGADMIVVGNAIEERPAFLAELCEL